MKSNGIDQNRVPFNERKINFTTNFLDVSVPFHSFYLEKAFERLKKDLIELKLEFSKTSIIPIISSEDGEEISNVQKCEEFICKHIVTTVVKWCNHMKMENITHVIDFGPGGINGIGRTCQ